MKICADTNVLVRALIGDDVDQAIVARTVLRQASFIAAPTVVLCEFSWVLASTYRQTPQQIAFAIRRFVSDSRVETDLPALHAGLEALDGGGDFADAVIAFDGRRLGGDMFVTFDRRAAARMIARNESVHLLSSSQV